MLLTGVIRSIVPDTVHVMALTATASPSTRKSIIKILDMQRSSIIYLPPVTQNIVYGVCEKPKLKKDRNMGCIIIFGQTYKDVIKYIITFNLHCVHFVQNQLDLLTM